MTAAATPGRDGVRELPTLDTEALRDLAGLGRRWVCWGFEDRGGPKPTKVPLQPNGSKASVTDPSTWSTYADAYAAAVNGLGDGLGVVLTGDGLVGVDLDHVVDADGNVDPKAQAIVDALDSYTEVSPSGTGLRVFARGKLPAGRRKRGNIEVYSTERYLTVTGRHLAGTPEAIEDRSAALAKFHAEHLGGADAGERVEYEERVADAGDLEELIRALGDSDERVRRLLHGRHDDLGYPSESEVDFSLACRLAGAGVDGGVIETALRWRRRGDGKDAQYFRRTTERALGAAKAEAERGARVDVAEDRSASPHSDVANAMRLRDHYGADLRWATGIGWLAWTGTHWAPDEMRARGVAQRLGRLIQLEAAGILSGKISPPTGVSVPDAAEERIRWAKASEMSVRTVAALSEARALLALDSDLLDRDRMLLGVANGTLDLSTGELLPHRREDWITRLAPVVYDHDAEAPEFLDFIDAITCGSRPLAAWLQRWCGYCLTGDVSEQVFAFAHGGGANGKSAWAMILEAVLGPYCARGMPDLLTAATGERHATELADLRGARVAICSEIERGRHWAESRIKQLTGEARITARRMRMDPIKFDATAKLVVLANTKPVVQDGGDSFWRRCRLVPFRAQFLGADADPDLPARIIENELPGVLVWMLDGLAAWRVHRLGAAPEIEEAVRQYRGESAEVATFLAECCERGDAHRVRAGELWAAYRAWAGERGATVQGREFAVAVAEAGFKRSRIHGYEHWSGLRLADDEGVGWGRGNPV